MEFFNFLFNDANLRWSVPAIVSAVIGLVAASIAMLSIRSARDIAKRKNAMEAINTAFFDSQQKQALRTINEITNNPDLSIATFAYPSDDEKHLQISRQIAHILNFYEYLAVGLTLGIYDEDVLKRAKFTTAIGIYDKCEAFIVELRKLNRINTTFMEFEKLVIRWKAHPLPVCSEIPRDGLSWHQL